MNKIKKLTIEHFKHFAGSTNREHLYITDEEWNDMIENVPLGKASGLTEIIYEDIKKAPDEFNSLLRKLIDNIFLQQELPEDWKDTNIYLIPNQNYGGLD
ncbi:hypothetical protein RhiirA5_419348 [Rhizophagus irregularis]|uniref:Uncharacterized protein n=1 Tax=Rhizophagus irregularis TaxID=588596 RepID=A0A2N0PIE8_9GLOM|nr:hypothetical protein RhiirA5_419348 [Rhizophagus irregularis]